MLLNFDINIKKLWLSASILICVIFCLMGYSARAESISQAYNSEIQISEGSAVALINNSQNTIELATQENKNLLLGVVVASQNSLVNINSDQGNTQVIVNGPANLLTCDINGEIANGDALTTSPIAGVAMKATETTRIIGFAQANFSSNSQKQFQTINNKKGENVKVAIVVMPVNIAIADYSPKNNLDNNGVISGVQSLAYNLSGKNISAVRALVALIVLLVAAIVSIVIVYSSVNSSIKAIGRNPLSKRTVLLSFVQIIIAVAIIMLSGLSIAYLIISR